MLRLHRRHRTRSIEAVGDDGEDDVVDETELSERMLVLEEVLDSRRIVRGWDILWAALVCS